MGKLFAINAHPLKASIVGRMIKRSIVVIWRQEGVSEWGRQYGGWHTVLADTAFTIRSSGQQWIWEFLVQLGGFYGGRYFVGSRPFPSAIMLCGSVVSFDVIMSFKPAQTLLAPDDESQFWLLHEARKI